MPSSCRPGFLGIAVFARPGAGASAIPEVYRRRVEGDTPPGARQSPGAGAQAGASTSIRRRSTSRNQIQ